MSGTYTIRTDPSVPQMQNARWKVPIEYRDQIEKTLDDMVLADRLSRFPSNTKYLPIPLAQNIQHVQLSTSELVVI